MGSCRDRSKFNNLVRKIVAGPARGTLHRPRSRSTIRHGLHSLKRVSDIRGHHTGHLPEDLDGRFAGVDTKLAAIREVLARLTTRPDFSKLEVRLAEVA